MSLNQFIFADSIDSLKNLIAKETNDSTKVELYLEISKEYFNGDEEHLMYVNKAYSLAQKTGSTYLIAATSFFKGSMLNYYDKYDSAVYYLEEAIKEFAEIQDTFYLAASWGELGNMFCYRAIYDECLDCFLKSLRYTEELGNKVYIGVTLNNIGGVYYLLEDYEKALEFYEESFTVYNEIKSEYGIALSSNNIGSVYLEYYDDLDSAYKYLKIAESYSEEIGFTEQLAETSANLARLFGLSDEFDLAKEYYNKSIQLNKQIQNRRGLAQSYVSFASLYFGEGLYVRAKEYLDSCIVVSHEIGALEFESQAYKWMYKSDSALNNFEGAFLNLMKYKNLNDSIAKSETQQNIASLQSEFDVERQEKENQILIEKQAKQDLIIQRQKLYNIFITIALGLFLGLLIMLFSILRQRKRHFEMLFSKNQEIMQQKEEILTQNDVLNQRNKEIENQRTVLEKYQIDTQGSINYAKRIQTAILPEISELKQTFSDAMLINMPKDIISGDFLFFKKFEKKSILAVADCTGHGVPGALMSILNMTLLKEVLRDDVQLTAAETLNKVRNLVKNVLKQSSDQRTIQDGMDIAMVMYDEEKQEINFAGAYRPLYHFRDNNLTELKADKQPIAAYIKEKPFTDNYLEIKNNDTIYIFSDGFYDQISMDLSKKFGIKQFRELISENQVLPLTDQKIILIENWKNWKQNARQTDDIIILAVKF